MKFSFLIRCPNNAFSIFSLWGLVEVILTYFAGNCFELSQNMRIMAVLEYFVHAQGRMG